MLYAEVHFRLFPCFPSLLFKREPEILFDIPHRIKPGAQLPILLILNDIHKFNYTPLEVSVTLSQPGNGTQLFHFKDIEEYKLRHPLDQIQAVYLFTIPPASLPIGEVFVNGKVTCKSGKKSITVFNDNITGSSRKAMRTIVTDSALPANELCDYGDLHVHSQFSQSHVEFGPPLQVIDTMADTSGLAFAAITDHSYDLACSLSDYLVEDESVPRWTLLREALRDRSAFSTLLIPGEEISCANSKNETVHLIGLGHTGFLPGSSDGARKKLKFKDQLTVKQAVTQIIKEKGIAFAAHPCSRSGLLQKLFLHRGHWHHTDFTDNKELCGIQALNNGFSASWDRGKALWISILQEGQHIPLLAGNDAHGDFSRYRAIKTPFLSIYENFNRFMGFAKTGLYRKCTTIDQVMETIRNGETFVTTGPYLSINTSEHPESHAVSAIPVKFDGSDKRLHVHAVSTHEFGRLKKISVFCGETDTQSTQIETLLFSKTMSSGTMDATFVIDCNAVKKGGYIRAEAESVLYDGTVNRAFTSACYIA